MSGVKKVVNLWQDENAVPELADLQSVPETGTARAVADQIEHDTADNYEPDVIKSHRPRRLWQSQIIAGFLLLAAVAWLALIGYVNWSYLAGRSMASSQIISLATTTAPPLFLLALIWSLTRRPQNNDAPTLTRLINELRYEKSELNALIAQTEVRLQHGMQALSAQGEQLDAVGEAALNRVTTLRATLGEEIGQISLHTNGLKNAAAAARSDMAVLMANLPKAHVETRKIAVALGEAGVTAQEQAQQLGAHLMTLSEYSRTAKTDAADAAENLAAHLAQMEQQSSHIHTIVEAGHATLATAGDTSVNGFEERVSKATQHVDQLGTALGAQNELAEKLFNDLRSALADVEGRLAAIDTHGTDRTERLTDAIKALTEHSLILHTALDKGGQNAESLIAKSEALMVSLDASAHEIDETIPAAFARLELSAGATHTKIAETLSSVEQLGTKVNAAHETLSDNQKLLSDQDMHVSTLHNRLVENNATAQSLAEALKTCEQDMSTLAHGTSAQLIDALLRVRETAQQASERAREAIEKVIPEAASAMGEASQTAIRDAISGQIEAEMMRISIVAEQAVKAAGAATDKLMRQMLTISETSTSFAAQIKEAGELHENNAQLSLSRRTSQLIESLNSISIDVTKILSNEVTDAAWASYLKGDRGIFTRRAVKLLDGGESREILRHYDNDPEFRDHVNHYIHNFEAMLRTVLSSRESGPLSVTLLSSDMGKLYVALAHAIERLRT